MTSRQKVFLYLLQQAGRTLSRLEVTKWCFLLAQESQSTEGKSFYQFVPYHYGPFSFSLHRDAESLMRDGMLEALGSRTWRLTASGRAFCSDLSPQIKKDIASIVERFGRKTVDQVIEYTYQYYPWATINSKVARRIKKPIGVLSVYTAGYEGLQIEGFLNMLIQRGIGLLIDVRNNPVARRYGFHKSTLSKLCEHLSIIELRII